MHPIISLFVAVLVQALQQQGGFQTPPGFRSANQHTNLPIHCGVVLPLNAEDSRWVYERGVREIAELYPPMDSGHVLLLIPHYMDNGTSTTITAHPTKTPTTARISEVLEAAKKSRLQVTLMPVVLLKSPRPGEWRGNIRPSDPDAWRSSYRELILTYATLAAENDVSWLCVGSELSSFDHDREFWSGLIGEVRGVFKGGLTYSANWDVYHRIPFWESLDAIGISAYFELCTGMDASAEELQASWRQHREELEQWRLDAELKQPFLFLELGYPSQRGGACKPWDYTMKTERDLGEQRRALEAFRLAWEDSTALLGMYIYSWVEYVEDPQLGYGIKGKPAEGYVAGWFEDWRGKNFATNK